MSAKRTVVVTGAAKGIGFACAKRFAEAGDRVMLLDVDADGLRKARAELGEMSEAHAIVTDVTDVASATRSIEKAYGLAGRLDALVNSAGIAVSGNPLTSSIEDFDRVISVNLRGTFICAQAAARLMVEQGHGSIVNMSSVNSRVAIPEMPAYCASKGAINQLTRSMAIALARSGVRVNAVAPGTIMTEMARAVLNSPKAMAGVNARTPMGRGGEPSEVADAVYYLSGKEASYITGEILFVDGGRTALNYTMPE
jgi:NAD(P)-dependent dehydrogenase (short-subunit alcohol dehydrogenase family)